MNLSFFFLTLHCFLVCLLHAQRLVPNTRASIKSATAAQPNWTVMSCVVDTEADSVRCFPESSVRKTTPEQSGTSISLLVPVSLFLLFQGREDCESKIYSSSELTSYRREVRRPSWHGRVWPNILLVFSLVCNSTATLKFWLHLCHVFHCTCGRFR